MRQNNLGLNFKPVTMDVFGINKNRGKRTLGTRDREILYIRAKKKCENCRKPIGLGEMQTGHKQAASRGGKATPGNSVCLCYHCNKLQGTDNWAVFRKKQGKSSTRTITSGKKRSSSNKGKKKGIKQTSPKDPFGINMWGNRPSDPVF
ncbi:MAG TPA: HNH endonuclease [Candidatus Nanoarchaeia archaeon]|nr:HNH endonuclease [Candidatus Nanoarchaeia archaeon]